MDVSITHVVGTVAILGLIIGAGAGYNATTSYLEAEVIKRQLNQVAEYVALNLVEIVNLVNFADFLNNSTMMKVLELPSELSGKGYLFMLVNETGQGRGYRVYAKLVEREDIAASSSIPVNSTQTQIVFIVDSEGTLQVRGEDENTILYSETVYSGAQNIVVWGWRRNDNTTWAGIGVWGG